MILRPVRKLPIKHKLIRLMKRPAPKSIGRAILTLALALAFSHLFSGCGSTKVTPETTDSVGQQLMDLEKAREQGTIDQKEYERLRRKIVREND